MLKVEDSNKSFKEILKMYKILVLTSEYCENAKANGLCAKAIVESLKEYNTSVYVISYQPQQISNEKFSEAIPVYISNNQNNRKNILPKKIKSLLNLIKYAIKPKYNKEIVNSFLNKINELYEQTKFDAIIGIYFPLETIVAGYKFCKKHKKIKFLIYELDSVKDGISGTGKWSKIRNTSSKYFSNKIYKKSHHIYILNCHKTSWLSNHIKYTYKMKLVDLPILTPVQPIESLHSSFDNTLIYAGVLSKEYRSPQKLLDVFEILKNECNLNLYFFSNGCEDMLNTYQNNNNKIHCMGYVEKKVLDQAISECVAVINIGNAVSNSLPSKLISYMASGKPIIHFSLQDQDVCKQYLDKYPLSLVISPHETISVISEKIMSFIKSINGKKIDYSTVSNLFPMNLPSYSTEIILNDLES